MAWSGGKSTADVGLFHAVIRHCPVQWTRRLQMVRLIYFFCPDVGDLWDGPPSIWGRCYVPQAVLVFHPKFGTSVEELIISVLVVVEVSQPTNFWWLRYTTD